MEEPKSYVDHMKAITPDELLEGLLGHGLFAEKLPPVFTSKSFYDYCKNRKFEGFEKRPCDYVRYDSIRNTNVPRRLAIPNPFAYMHLCVCIHCYWDKIVKKNGENTSNQKYKRSQIHIRKLKGKDGLFEMNLSYENKEECLEAELFRLPIMKRFKVDADISSCYPKFILMRYLGHWWGKKKPKNIKMIKSIKIMMNGIIK